MPETQNIVGMIEMDVASDGLAPTRLNAHSPRGRLADTEHPRLKTTVTQGVTVERILADTPRLASELRAELRQFLERLQATP